MSLLELKSYESKITSTNNEQLDSASVQSICRQTSEHEKVTAKAAPSTPKQGTTKPWLY